jgi:hypothetical protein
MKETGGPAFPTQQIVVNEQGQITGFAVDADGMSLRDYFAAKAMQGICARVQWSPRGIVETAYSVADAMMEARK